MAGNGLPIYYKNSKLVGPQSTRKKWKEYYLLVCTVVGFIILIAGVLWFVPSVEEDKSYNKAYSSFTGPSLGGITDSSDNPEPVGQAASPLDKEHLLKRDADSVPEIDPRQRKLEEDRREPIPVPGRGRPNNIEGGVPLEQRREENDIIVQKEEEHREERENYGEDVNQKQENNVADEVQSKDGEGGKKDAAVEEPELVEEEQEDPVTKQRREKIVEVNNVCCLKLIYSRVYPCSSSAKVLLQSMVSYPIGAVMMCAIALDLSILYTCLYVHLFLAIVQGVIQFHVTQS